jgi:iron complex transport system substrate-binding protein
VSGPRRGALLATATISLLGALAGCGLGSSGDAAGRDDPSTGGGSAPAAAIVGDAPPADPQLPTTVTSADGREVTVTSVERILPLTGSISEVVFALGMGDRVVGRDISATFDEAADLPLVTRAHDVAAESVLSLQPTVVLADEETGPPEAIEHIRNVGVPVVIVERPTDLAAIGPRIEAVAAALGVGAAGAHLAAATAAEMAAVAPAAPHGAADPDSRPTVAFLYLRGQAGVYLMGGPGAGTDAMIEAAGGRDAGTELGLAQAFTPLTSEALVEAAPDVLLLTTTGLESVGGIDGLLEVAGIAQTPAGRDRRVATIEDGLLFGFGTRTPEVLRDLASQLGASEAAS